MIVVAAVGAAVVEADNRADCITAADFAIYETIPNGAAFVVGNYAARVVVSRDVRIGQLDFLNRAAVDITKQARRACPVHRQVADVVVIAVERSFERISTAITNRREGNRAHVNIGDEFSCNALSISAVVDVIAKGFQVGSSGYAVICVAVCVRAKCYAVDFAHALATVCVRRILAKLEDVAARIAHNVKELAVRVKSIVIERDDFIGGVGRGLVKFSVLHKINSVKHNERLVDSASLILPRAVNIFPAGDNARLIKVGSCLADFAVAEFIPARLDFAVLVYYINLQVVNVIVRFNRRACGRVKNICGHDNR